MTGGKPIRIVHYQQQLRGHESGTSNAARGWCEAVARQGIDVVGLYDSADVGRPAPEGTETVALEHSLRGSLRTPRGIAEHILQADAVVIHGGWLLGNNAVGRACVRARVPFLITTHGVYMSEVLRRRTLRKRVWAAALERRYLSRASAVHVFFPEEYVNLEQAMKTKAPSIVAPNGIDYPEGVSWNGNEGYLLWLGRFDIVTKGLDLLVRAVERIPAQHRPQLRLHGPDWRNQKNELRRLVGQLGIGRWVTIGDPVYGDEKWQPDQQCACLCLPLTLGCVSSRRLGGRRDGGAHARDPIPARDILGGEGCGHPG